MEANTKEHANKSEWEEKYKRARADYINLERRVKEQQKDFLKFANSVLILKLLPVLDDLEKVVASGKDEGLNLLLKNFGDVLKSEGVEEIEVGVGGKFDPQTMECTVAEDTGEDAKVAEVLRKGYRMRGKMLRPAQVKVRSKISNS